MYIDLEDKPTRFLVQEYVNQICNYSSEDELNYDVHKLIHTFKVVEMAKNLINKTRPALSPQLKEQILNAALLHDVGRCHEFKNGQHLKVDHGKIGADLIKKNFPKMKIEAQSTFFHNKLPSDKDPTFCQPVLDYVRDADMLANLKYQIEEADVALKPFLSDKNNPFLNPVIDDEIFQSAKENRPAKTEKIKIFTLLTMLLEQLCWKYNIKTDAGIKYATKEKLFVRFKQMILKKIVPLTTKNKKKQKELIQKIQETFPDKKFK